jgi:hypothetical protein
VVLSRGGPALTGVAGALVATVGPDGREVLVRLGERLVEPAASWCRELADLLAQARTVHKAFSCPLQERRW